VPPLPAVDVGLSGNDNKNQQTESVGREKLQSFRWIPIEDIKTKEKPEQSEGDQNDQEPQPNARELFGFLAAYTCAGFAMYLLWHIMRLSEKNNRSNKNSS
jgi:hypothetical protein